MIKITEEELKKMEGKGDDSYNLLQKILHNYVVWITIVVGIPFFVMIISFGKLSTNVEVDPLISPTPTQAIILSTPIPRAGDGRRIGGPTPNLTLIPALGLTIAPTSRAASALQVAQNAIDTEPPRTQILYPIPGSALTSASGGKACIAFSPLYDNKSKSENITLTYSLDAGTNHAAKGVSAACADSIYNGTHTFIYFLTDEAGNKSESKSLQFTLNIPGFDVSTPTPIPPTITPTPTLTPTLTPTP